MGLILYGSTSFYAISFGPAYKLAPNYHNSWLRNLKRKAKRYKESAKAFESTISPWKLYAFWSISQSLCFHHTQFLDAILGAYVGPPTAVSRCTEGKGKEIRRARCWLSLGWNPFLGREPKAVRYALSGTYIRTPRTTQSSIYHHVKFRTKGVSHSPVFRKDLLCKSNLLICGDLRVIPCNRYVFRSRYKVNCLSEESRAHF